MIIALEGIDGSGKSTAAAGLEDWLRRQGLGVVVVRWASFLVDDTETVAGPFEAAQRLKVDREMGPLSYALWHCADFAHRWELLAEPALARNEVLLSDRYKYSGLVRGAVRGIDEGYLQAIYDFAPEPDLTLFLDVDPAVALRRKIQDSGRPGYYESGNDIFQDLDRQASFLKFQDICRRRYRDILPLCNLHEINASMTLDDVRQAVCGLATGLLGAKEGAVGKE